MFVDFDENQQKKMTRHDREKMILEILQRTTEDLLENEADLPEEVVKSRVFLKRKSDHLESLVEEEFGQMSSQKIVEIERFGQIPKYVTSSEQFKKKLNHLTKQEKSDRLALKNVRETVEILKKIKTAEAVEQRRIITAALSDSVYGCPNIGESKDIIKQAKKSKTDLLVGKTQTLKLSKQQKHKVYPKSVIETAEKCWRNDVTRVEPATHARPHLVKQFRQSIKR